MVVGITGGIGSGKTTVLKEFQKRGSVAVYIADKEAKELMNTSPIIKKGLVDVFGKEAYINEQLNRPYISDIVFKDSEKLSELNSIVHPAVFDHFKTFVLNNKDKAYVLYENAILFENGSDALCDVIITVVARKSERINRVIARDKVRIKRVVTRDNVTEKEVVERMNNQWSESKKILQSNYVVNNNASNCVESQIVRIHNNLTENQYLF